MSSPGSSGLITASYGNRGRLEAEDGQQYKFILKGRRIRAVCGDRVEWQHQSQGNEVLVTGIVPRENALERPDPRGKPELLAANLSRLAVVLAPEPEPDWFLTDRYLAAAELIGSDALLIWNKTDIAGAHPDDLQIYAQLGYACLDTSADAGTGIAELAAHLADGINMLAGQSGVGKSSLINKLVTDAEVVTGELSEASGEGRHTTTASMMHQLPGGGRLIDSPGVREYAPFIQEPGRVQVGYREILEHAQDCRFADCQHLREPNCAVKNALESGAINTRRYESYKRLRNMVVQRTADEHG